MAIAQDKPKVDDSSYNLKGEIGLSRGFLFHCIHCIRASEVRSMKIVVPLSVDIVRIVSVCLLSCSFVDEERVISIEHRPFSIFHPEIAGKPLTQAVNKIAFDLGANLDVIIAVYDVLIVCGEDSIVVGFS